MDDRCAKCGKMFDLEIFTVGCCDRVYHTGRCYANHLHGPLHRTRNPE